MIGFCLKSLIVVVVAVVSFQVFTRVDKESLKGKKVLVTGASQNIGEEIAYQYSQLGAEVVVTARRETELKRVVKRCIELGAKDANYVVADMSVADSYISTVESAVKMLGGLDILVLNHVVSRHGRFNGSQADMEYLSRAITLNYLSYIHLAMAAMPHLDHSDGQLIVVSSQAGRPGIPNVAGYGASKAALNNFFTSLQMENLMYKKQSPTITLCTLGAIDTQGAKWFLAEHALKLKGYPVKDTAAAIIEGGVARQRHVFIPFYLRFATLIREMSPALFDRALLYFVFRA